jgi:predicted transcriptional regulator
MEPTTWIRVSQVAEELGLSPQAVRNLIRSRKLHGRKNDGRWLVEAASTSRYLAAHGRRRHVDGDLVRLQQQVNELAQAVEAILQGDTSKRSQRIVERERDQHRADLVTAKEVALGALASARATRSAISQLLEGMGKLDEALVQQLMPGSLDDELTMIERES